MTLISSYLQPHIEAISAVALTVAPLLLPAINRRLAVATGDARIKIAFKIADALRDGVQVQDVVTALTTIKASGQQQPD